MKIKRTFDLWFSFLALISLAIPMALICLLIKLDSKGPIIYWSKRIGQNKTIFLMPKFRTMLINTPQVATHLLNEPDKYVTSLGMILRKYSIDEFPQLVSIFFGKMTFVGPRPALFNQDDLIKLRESKGIDHLRPGITGWAQVNGRDELSIEEKVTYEREYLERKSFFFDLYIIWLTLKKVILRDGISH